MSREASNDVSQLVLSVRNEGAGGTSHWPVAEQGDGHVSLEGGDEGRWFDSIEDLVRSHMYTNPDIDPSGSDLDGGYERGFDGARTTATAPFLLHPAAKFAGHSSAQLLGEAANSYVDMGGLAANLEFVAPPLIGAVSDDMEV